MICKRKVSSTTCVRFDNNVPILSLNEKKHQFYLFYKPAHFLFHLTSIFQLILITPVETLLSLFRIYTYTF